MARKEKDDQVRPQEWMLAFALKNAKFVRDLRNDVWAHIEVDGKFELFEVDSDEIRNWLAVNHVNETGIIPSEAALDSATRAIKAFGGKGLRKRRVCLRIAGEVAKGKVFVDLADATGQCVQIDANGWKLRKAFPVAFRRTAGQFALPTPEAGDGAREFDNLWALFPSLSASDRTLILGWLVAALHPCGPYPVLIITGSQGSGKSTLVMFLRLLLDPGTPIDRMTPTTERDLMIYAYNSRVVSCNNVSFIRDKISDAFCVVSSDGGFATRRLYTGLHEELFHETRPVILNGIGDFALRGDLLDRATRIALAPPSSRAVRTAQELESEFLAIRPRLMGALFDAVTCALRALPGTKVTEQLRMADAARWVEAAAPALGLDPGQYVAAYIEQRIAAKRDAILENEVGSALLTFLARRGSWKGSCTELLNGLESVVKSRGRTWPNSAPELTKCLVRIEPMLLDAGWRGERGKSRSIVNGVSMNRRWWRFERVPDADSLPGEPTEVQARAHDQVQLKLAAAAPNWVRLNALPDEDLMQEERRLLAERAQSSGRAVGTDQIKVQLDIIKAIALARCLRDEAS